MARFSIVNARLACLPLSVLLAMCATPAVAGGNAEAEVAAATPERVLFIGNSHTRRHGGLDWQIGNFVAAEEVPRNYEGEIVADGGATLADHWARGVAHGIGDGDFDVVVLQGWLAGASTASVEPFLEHVRLFDEAITDAGARTVLFMTWPRDQGDWSTLDDAVAAHRRLERELGADVAPAALAIERARAERPDLQLIDADGIHATWTGAYLAAATVYATLFERSPEGLDYDFGVDPETADYLQRVAAETLAAWRAEGA